MIENQSTTQNRAGLTYEVADDEAVSEAVVEAVSTASNVAPETMDPLAESVDPDALDGIFADRYDGTPRTGGQIRFSFSGYDVVVTDGRLVSVVDASR